MSDSEVHVKRQEQPLNPLELAEDLFSKGKFKQAIVSYQRLGEQNLPASARLKLAQCYTTSGDLLKAKECYEAIPDIANCDIGAQLNYASLLYDSFEYQKAMTLLDQLKPKLGRKSDQTRVNTFLNTIEQVQSEPDKASTSLAERLLTLRDNARRAYSSKDYSTAHRLYSDIERQLALRAEEVFDYARSAYKLKRTEEARELVDIAIDRGFQGQQLALFLAEIAIQSRDFDEAEKRVLRLNQEHTGTHLFEKLGHLAFSKSMIDIALNYYQKFFATARDPQQHQIHKLRYAKLLQLRARNEEAYAMFSGLDATRCGLTQDTLAILQSKSPAEYLKMVKAKVRNSRRPALSSEQSVTSVVVTMRPQFLGNVIHTFNSQSYKNKRLILVMNKADFTESPHYSSAIQDPLIRIVDGSSAKYHGGLVTLGVSHAEDGLIAIMDDDDLYGPFYLEKLIRRMRETNAKVVGKESYFVYIEAVDELRLYAPNRIENSSAMNLTGSSMLCEKSYFEDIGFPDLYAGADSEFYRRVKARGDLMIADDYFDYVLVRMKDANTHTWKASNDCLRLSTHYIGNANLKNLILH